MIVNDELERIWKKAIRPNVWYCQGIFLDKLRKTIKYLRIVGVPAKIRSGNLPNASMKCYSLKKVTRFMTTASYSFVEFSLSTAHSVEKNLFDVSGAYLNFFHGI
jgi:hypothetical protein